MTTAARLHTMLCALLQNLQRTALPLWQSKALHWKKKRATLSVAARPLGLLHRALSAQPGSFTSGPCLLLSRLLPITASFLWFEYGAVHQRIFESDSLYSRSIPLHGSQDPLCLKVSPAINNSDYRAHFL